jgi:DNA-binding IclR family transcriptional regulator
MPPNEDNDAKYRIELVEKTFAILDAFRPERRELSVREMVEETGQTQSSVYRIVANLTRLGILDQDQPTRKYRVGSKLYALGSLAVLDVRKLAMSRMEALRERFAFTVSLSAAHDRSGGTLVEVLESHEPYGVALGVGTREPLHCTASGKCALAYVTDAQRDALLEGNELERFTDATLSTREELDRAVAEVRRQGYAVDAGEWAQHVNCIAVPIFDRTGKLCGAISLSGPSTSPATSSLHEAIPAMLAACGEISRELGYTEAYPPCDPVGEPDVSVAA